MLKAILGLFLMLSLVATAVEEPRRVLIVHSFGRDFAPFCDVSESFRAAMSRTYDGPFILMDASLEMARFDGEDRDGPLLDYLSVLHHDKPPHLVVPIGAQAAKFCLRHRERIFPGSPVLMLGIDVRRFEGLVGVENTAMVGERLEPDGYIRNILTLLPDTKHIHLVMGTSPLEKFWHQAFLDEWKEFEDRVTFHSLSDLSVVQMQEAVKNLPPHSAVLVGVVNLDAAGVPHEAESALMAIHETSQSPVFGMLPTQLGFGIIGGPTSPGSLMGDEGAKAAASIFNGTPASSLPVTVLNERAPAYDWRELQRWEIPESRLPLASSILFRPPGFWSKHRNVILVAAGLVVLQWVLIGRLLAARKRAREADASLGFAADAANIGLWQRRANTDRFTATPRWREIFGLPAEGDLPMRDLLECLHPDDRVRMTSSIAHAAELGVPFALEHRVVLPDGAVRWVATHGRTEAGRDAGDFGTRGASMDITERREAAATAALQRQELAHLSRVSSLGVLSGALAHELNQPLAIILSNAQAAEFLLEAEEPDLDELRAIIGDIVREDQRAGDVIRRLRALLRRGETTPQPLQVNDSVSEVLQLTHSDLVARHVTATTRFGEALPLVRADRVQLQQVLLNLILNACDAMAENDPQDRELVIETQAAPGEVRIIVRDRGTGIAGDPEKLFEPFHTTKEQGLGMGLAICRTLITAHGGRLWAEPGPGRGASFHVALPTTGDLP